MQQIGIPGQHTNDTIERQRFALQAAGIGTWNLDPVHGLVDWDERGRELYGFPSQDTLGYEGLLNAIHPGDRHRVREAIARALDPRNASDYDIQFRISAAGGGLRWVYCKGKAYFDKEERPFRFSGTIQDISQAVQDREKASASEKIAQVALEHSNSGYFYISSMPGELEYSSGYARILTGAEKKGLKREDFVQHIHPDDRAIRSHALETAARTGELDYEARTVWDDGSIHWMRAKGICHHDAAGKPVLLTGTISDTTAEHAHREATKKAEDLLATAFNNASVGMAFGDFQGQLLRVNAAYAQLLGYTAEELCGHQFQDFTHPDDLEKNAMLFAELVSGKRHYFNLATRYLHQDGTQRWVQVNLTLITPSAGEEGRVMILARDVSSETAKEKALAASEALFKNVTKSSPTGLWLSDEAGGLTYLNNTLVEWTGMAYDDLLGAGWANAIVEGDRQRAANTFLDAVAARTHYDVVFRLSKGNGSVAWCRAAGDPFYREDGSYAGYAGFCMDIHEMVTIANELKAGESRFRSIVEQAPMAIGLLQGRDMLIEVGNDKIFEVWGKDRSITGMLLMDALPEIKGQGFFELLQTVYDTGEPFSGNGALAKLERRGKLEEAYFDFVYTPLRAADGTVTGIMVLATEVTEQHIARKALEESENRFRTLIEEAPFATALYHQGAELTIEMANEAMIGLWGKDQTVIGMPLRQALPELDGQPFISLLQNVFSTGIAYHSQEARADLVVNGKLTTFYFNFTYKPLKNKVGEVYAILNMAVDVTDQVNARKKLEESELFSRSIIYNSPVAKLVLTGEDMFIHTINENMLEMIGRDASIIGKPLMDVLPELAETPLMERLRYVLATGETYFQPEEKLELARYGAPYTGYYNYIYKALRDTAGRRYGVVVTATEVTEQVAARQKVEEAESNLRGAIELAELGTWHIDLATGILDYSERLRKWFGIGSNEIITIDRAYKAIRPFDLPEVKAAMQHATMAGMDNIYDVEYRVEASVTGRVRVLHAQGKAFFNEKGEAYKISGTVQDVTAQRTLQLALEQEVLQRTEELQAVNEELSATNEELFESNERLIRSNEELAQYAYVASHDLQEPLRKIRMFSGMLENQSSLSAEHKPLVLKIAQSSERMSLLIRDLLEFSRLLKSEGLVRPVNLQEVTHAVVNDFELAIEEKKATVVVGKMPVVQAIGLQMNQLFYNLLSNALKFNKSGRSPVIEISSRPIAAEEAARHIQKPFSFAQYHHITVTDNGIGFEVKYAEQIFEVFKRLHGREMYPGSGIGLALCRRIVGNHNGSLYAESTPGEGTVFHLILPDQQHEHEPNGGSF